MAGIAQDHAERVARNPRRSWLWELATRIPSFRARPNRGCTCHSWSER
jgi:hypothetical protein